MMLCGLMCCIDYNINVAAITLIIIIFTGIFHVLFCLMVKVFQWLSQLLETTRAPIRRSTAGNFVDQGLSFSEAFMSKPICSYIALDVTSTWSHSMELSFLWICIYLNGLWQADVDQKGKEEPIFISPPRGTFTHLVNSHSILRGRLHFKDMETRYRKER